MILLRFIAILFISSFLLLHTSCENERVEQGQIDNNPLSMEPTEASATKTSDDKSNELLERDKKEVSDQILILINEYRLSKNLIALSDNTTAKIEALNHSEYQANLNAINHDNGNERANVLFMYEDAKSYGENVAFGFKTAKAVVDAWIGSEGHRLNLEGDFTKSGIGTIANDKEVLYFTHILFK